MKGLSRQAQLYIWDILLAGAVLSAWGLASLRLSEPASRVWLLLAVGALASLAQGLKVQGATAKSSYNISWVVYAFAFVLLGAPAALWVVLVAHLVEWVWHKYPWFVQAFNIATYALAIQAASLVSTWVNPGPAPLSLAGALGIMAAMAAFTYLNHVVVGVVIHLARGESLAQSGVLGALPLMIDFSLLCLGAAAALIWQLNPFAAILSIIPLYLIYNTLKVPALQRQADVDSKTGLFNARHLIGAFTQELARADRFDRPLTIVMADLDHLRHINNTYGHLAGDVVLIGLAHLLQSSFRDYDVVARFGGEEFCILMPEASPTDALKRVEAARAAVEAAAFNVETSLNPIKATMSFGVAGRQRQGQSVEEVLHCADLALYQAKAAGRNRVCLFATEGQEDSDRASRPATASQIEAPPVAPPQTGEAISGTMPALKVPEAAVLRPERPVPPAAQARPAWLVNVYIGGVALAALGLLRLSLGSAAVPDWAGLVMFVLIVLAVEWLAIDIYARDTSVSTSAAPLIAGALLFGPVGGLVLSLVLAGTSLVKHRSPISRFVFNAGNHLLSCLLCVGLVMLTGSSVSGLPMLAQVGLSLLAAGVVYLSSTLLVAGAISLTSGQPFHQVWSERFRWLAPYYLALGVVAYALLFSYLKAGLLGVLVSLVPLLILRFSQKQYLDRTTALVSQLRTTNEALRQRAEEVSGLNEELLLALSYAVDLRDPHVQGHSQHVARYATLIAQELGLPPERIELVRKAGLLHDIGKLGISESILFKPARLTPAEYEIVKQHAALGEELIGKCHSLHALLPFVRHHHEHYDGRGYPDRLRAHAIPLEARILSVADAVEAMASDRPYRRGMDGPAILAEIQKHAGTQFDPAVAAAFVQVVQTTGAAVIVNSTRAEEAHDGLPDGRSQPLPASTVPTTHPTRLLPVIAA